MVVKPEPPPDASSVDTEPERNIEADSPRKKVKNISEGKTQEKGDKAANLDEESESDAEADSDEEAEVAPPNDE